MIRALSIADDLLERSLYWAFSAERQMVHLPFVKGIDRNAPADPIPELFFLGDDHNLWKELRSHQRQMWKEMDDFGDAVNECMNANTEVSSEVISRWVNERGVTPTYFAELVTKIKTECKLSNLLAHPYSRCGPEIVDKIAANHVDDVVVKLTGQKSIYIRSSVLSRLQSAIFVTVIPVLNKRRCETDWFEIVPERIPAVNSWSTTMRGAVFSVPDFPCLFLTNEGLSVLNELSRGQNFAGRSDGLQGPDI